ncbi:MAG: hypothetical protein FWD40_09375 [Treponema sp.]|nr:hypothetical protein [Treponema sp.]
MNIKVISFFSACVLLAACGIDEYYYLPQVNPSSVARVMNTDAEIRIPSITSFSYATGYIIFYKIYLSSFDAGSWENLGLIHSTLVSDYNALLPFTDPANTTLITSLNTFTNRRYHELEFPLNRDQGILDIRFPTQDLEFPTGTFTLPNSNITGEPVLLERSSRLISPEPDGDPYFRNTSGLNNSVNTDVALGANNASQHAYAAMYICAIGQNPQNFSRIYSKPTFISVFKLPNAY